MFGWKTALGLVATAVARDVVVKPRQVAGLARSYCDRVGKPLLNINGGSRSMQSLVAGVLCCGDVNIAPDAPVNAATPESFVHGNPYDLSMYPDGHFGAVVAIGVLERLRRPDAALIEWRRVANKVFVAVPSWYSPLMWLDPHNRWYITQDLSKAWPTVWTDQERVFLLPTPVVSDNISRRWIPERPTSPTSPSPPQVNASPANPPTSPSSTDSTRANPPSRRLQASSRTTGAATGSSSSVSTLTVLSGDDSATISPSRSSGGPSRSGG